MLNQATEIWYSMVVNVHHLFWRASVALRAKTQVDLSNSSALIYFVLNTFVISRLSQKVHTKQCYRTTNGLAYQFKPNF